MNITVRCTFKSFPIYMTQRLVIIVLRFLSSLLSVLFYFLFPSIFLSPGFTTLGDLSFPLHLLFLLFFCLSIFQFLFFHLAFHLMSIFLSFLKRSTSMPAFLAHGATMIPDPIIVLDDKLDALHAPLTNRLTKSAISMQLVKLSQYQYE